MIKRIRVHFLWLVVAAISLACNMGVLRPSDPIFMAPDGGAQWTSTPAAPIPSTDATPTPATDALPLVSNPIVVTPQPTAPESVPASTAPILYYTQAGDTLPVVAARFGVQPEEIISANPVPATALIAPNQLLIIPHRLDNTTSSQKLIPDSEVVFSPSAIDFDIAAFASNAGGYLGNFREWLGTTEWTTGAEIIGRIARENSINPRLLLALLEFQSNWVYGQPSDFAKEDYPMGQIELRRKGLYLQLAWTVNHIATGYYGWREGWLTEITFSDGVTARLAPDLNAGTVAIQYYLAQIFDSTGWIKALDPVEGFPALYERMFGNAWMRAQQVEPLYPPDLVQPGLELPFLIGQVWSFSGGPHGAWEHDGARAALDFAPGSTESGCVPSAAWVVASAPGLVVRSGNGVVVLDLDGDGSEQTGWALLYLHVSTDQRIQAGEWVETGDLLGHPSCEGGTATGTHVHMARKYNGEWIPADGPLPFNLSGWEAHAGDEPYEGILTRGEEKIPASIYGSFESRIVRSRENP